MDSLLFENLLGEMPNPKPEDVDAYIGDHIVIALPKIDIYTEVPHIHGGYQFIIPFTTSPTFKVEKRKILIEQNKFFPFNHEQIHQVANPDTELRLLAIFIDKDYLNETAYSVYGRKETFFENVNVKLDGDTQNLIHMFMNETRNQQSGYEFILQGLSTNITINLLRQVKSNLPSVMTRQFTERESINKAIDFLWENYKEAFSLQDVARVANLSVNHFVRSFKHETGKTPFEYLLEIKIERAKEMLRRKQLNITEVCFSCGFNNNCHFTTVFKKKVGITPSTYRQAFLGI